MAAGCAGHCFHQDVPSESSQLPHSGASLTLRPLISVSPFAALRNFVVTLRRGTANMEGTYTSKRRNETDDDARSGKRPQLNGGQIGLQNGFYGSFQQGLSNSFLPNSAAAALFSISVSSTNPPPVSPTPPNFRPPCSTLTTRASAEAISTSTRWETQEGSRSLHFLHKKSVMAW